MLLLNLEHCDDRYASGEARDELHNARAAWRVIASKVAVRAEDEHRVGARDELGALAGLLAQVVDVEEGLNARQRLG